MNLTTPNLIAAALYHR